MSKKCNMMGLGLFGGFILGLTCATRKGKEFRKDIWEGYRKGGIMGKWRVVTNELSGAGQELINTFDELFRSPEMKDAIEKGKVQLEKLHKEGEKRVAKAKKTVAKKASATAKKASTAAKSATKKAGNTMKRTVKKIS